MRSFIAINLPANDQLVRLLAENGPTGRSVEGKNLHLTLKFLGDIREVDGVRRSLKEIRFSKFSITLKGMGAFPNPTSGRVLFVRAFPENLLKELAAEVDSKTRDIPLDHPFDPHITILRAKGRRNFSDLISKFESTVFLEQEVTSFSLFESILRPTGPIYNEIQKYQLI